jgi:hypothetical protein
MKPKQIKGESMSKTSTVEIKVNKLKIEYRESPDMCIWIAGDHSLQAHICPKTDIELVFGNGRRFSCRARAKKLGIGVDATEGLVAEIAENTDFVVQFFPDDQDVVNVKFRFKNGALIALVPAEANLWAFLPMEERNPWFGGHVGASWKKWDGKQPPAFSSD